MVEETGTWIVLQKRGLLIITPCKHKYRVLNRSMADVLEVMGAWLALNGDDYLDQVAGAVMMLAGGSRRRRRRRLRIAAALAVCTRRHRAPPEYIRLAPDTPQVGAAMWDRLEGRASWWNSLFRLTVDEFFFKLVPHLYLPTTFEIEGHSCEATLAVLMLLARLSAPRSLCPDLEIIFKQDKTRLSRFIRAAEEHLFMTFAYTFSFDTQRVRANLPWWAHQVGKKYGADDPSLFRIWGFLDGTFRYIARPRAE
jgi:hypothetical protein